MSRLINRVGVTRDQLGAARTYYGSVGTPKKVIPKRRHALDEWAETPAGRRTAAAQRVHARAIVDDARQEEDITERGRRCAPECDQID